MSFIYIRHKRKKYSKQLIMFKFLLKFFLTLFLLTIFIRPTIATLNLVFLYFNPDSAQTNFSTLIRSIDSFFEKSGLDIPSQAFSQKIDFDNSLKEGKPALVLVPVWYYQRYGDSMGFKPLLSALNNGKSSYSKIILTRKGEGYSLEDLKTKTIAMTTMGPETEEIFAKMYAEKYGIDLSDSNIIITPKDADALYALVLGQVDAALVGKDTLEIVGKVNHRLLDMVEKVAVSQSFPMPLLCIAGDNLSEQEILKIKKLFMGGGHKLPHPGFMQMLRIDGWKIFQE